MYDKNDIIFIKDVSIYFLNIHGLVVGKSIFNNCLISGIVTIWLTFVCTCIYMYGNKWFFLFSSNSQYRISIWLSTIILPYDCTNKIQTGPIPSTLSTMTGLTELSLYENSLSGNSKLCMIKMILSLWKVWVFTF